MWWPVLLFLAVPAASAEDPPPSAEAVLGKAREHLAQQDAEGALEASAALATDARTCELLVLRARAHEQRSDPVSASSLLHTFFDLGCDQPELQAEATTQFTRLLRRGMLEAPVSTSGASPADPAEATDAPRDEWAFENIEEDPDPSDPDLEDDEDEIESWDAVEIPDGSLTILDSRAYLLDYGREGYRLRFEILVRGADPETAVDLQFNPPGASWLTAEMTPVRPGHYRTTLRIARDGDTHWRIRVFPSQPFEPALITDTSITRVR